MCDQSLAFRVATSEDSKSIIPLVNSVYRGRSARQWTSESELLEGPRLDAELYAGMLAQPGSIVLIASDSSGLVGCVHLEMSGDQCLLGMLTVKATHQQSGLGKAIMRHAENYARDVFAAKTVIMHVIDTRHELIAWYERRGYRWTGERLPFAGDAASRSRSLQGPLWFATMAKVLATPEP